MQTRTPPSQDEIAIIGISLRFPGAETLQEFWAHLVAEKSLITEVPRERWDKENFFGDARKQENKTNSIWGGFINDADCFDAAFFNISPREAESMDPQQRLALELAWKAIEDAGYRAGMLAGSQTGVFMGVCHWDYAELMEKEGAKIDAYFPTGTAYSIIANRISYFFDFHGPSISNDTACSSSLVSIYQAVRTLQHGECDYALAGGVNLCWSPKHFIAFAKSGMLSRTGRSRAFDSSADGYVRGEGGAVLLLKPLSKAIADRDPIYAVIKGVGTNHGGRTNSLTATNPEAQARLITELYQKANISPDTVSYIEAHGPGTPLGDPIEVVGLKTAFKLLYESFDKAPQEGVCGLGSVKTNIGHLEGAAGVAGVVKVIGAMLNRVLPASLNFTHLNSLITLDGSPLYIVDKTQPWLPAASASTSSKRRAGVSSFGFGGTNAHLILEEYPQEDGRATETSPARALEVEPHLIPLSAKTPERLLAVAHQLLAFLKDNCLPNAAEADSDVGQPHCVLRLEDLAYTLQVGREAMGARAVFLVSSMTQLLEKLEAFVSDGVPVDGCWRGQPSEDKKLSGASAGNDDSPAGTRTSIQEHRLREMAQAWVVGEEVEWETFSLHQRPRRLRLPTYPFDRKRYWFPLAVEHSQDHPVTDRRRLSPLLHENTSDSDEHRFSTLFDGSEFFLRDHLIRGEKILPGVVYLEMVRAAIRESVQTPQSALGRICLSKLAWINPFVVGSEPVSIHVRLLPRSETHIAFEIYGGERAADTPRPLLCQGYADIITSEERPSLDLQRLQAECGAGTLSAPECYAALRRLGFEYGRSFQALEYVLRGEGQALAKLSLPETLRAELAAYVLHPSLMDSSLQAALLLMRDEGAVPTGDSSLPFALDVLEILGECTSEMWAWVREGRRGAGDSRVRKTDIDLYDRSGQLCARLLGLSYRTLPAAPEVPNSVTALAKPAQSSPVSDAEENTKRVVYATNRWIEQAAECSFKTGHANRDVHCFVAGVAATSLQKLRDVLSPIMPGLVRIERLPELQKEHLVQGIEVCFRTCFERIQQIFQDKPARPQHVLIVVPDDKERYCYAPLVGLLKTAHAENPALTGKVIFVAGLESASIDRLCELLCSESSATDVCTEVRYTHARQREVCVISEVHLPAPQGQDATPIKAGGVYWITGGLGGLGLIFSTYLGRVKGVNLILSGRSALDAAKRERLSDLRRAGIRVSYFQSDISRYEDVQSLVRSVLNDHGRIDGIFHSAGVINDAFILHKQASEIGEVMAPKLTGTLNIDAATSNLSLDFMVLFSSVAGSYGNAGQADYAGANAFLNAFAEYRQAAVATGQRSGKTLAIGWPLWEEGGMQIAQVYLDSLRRAKGWEALPTEAGLSAFGKILVAEGVPQLTLTYGRAAHLREQFTRTSQDQTHPIQTAPAPVVLSPEELKIKTIALLKARLSEVLRLEAEAINAGQKLEEYGLDSISIVELTGRLEDSFGPLSKTLFFEYTNLREVADYFVEQHQEKVKALFGSGSQASDVATGRSNGVSTSPDLESASGEERLTTIEVEPRLKVREHADPYHDIAVIGMAGRYPKAENLDEFWEILKSGADCFEDIPAERWNHDAIYFPGREVLGKTVIKNGTFLRDIDKFDPRYFHISRRDAELMSPEVRLFLQVGVEALEDAGYAREYLQRRYQGDVGVLVGTMSNHYGLYGFQNNLVRGAQASGSYTGTLPNMLSYFYGFTGPSIFLDTMCSGSSTCIHQAVQMLRARECKMVVAGGINLILHPYNLISSSQEHFTTSTAQVIRSYGLGADGTIIGEGIGALVLKPLIEAERDGDHIYGVIIGTALTNAGVRNGFTVPSPHLQALAIEKALLDAEISPRSVSYLEGHGSGTKLGDPIEIKGLSMAYEKQTRDLQFCPIGSVKSNIAHLLAAAGVAGITKVLLQLHHEKLVPSLHAEALNPDIPFADTAFYVQRESTDWNRPVIRDDGQEIVFPRRAGVTSIGAGGMNSHILLEEYIPRAPVIHHLPSDCLMVFSAMNREALNVYLELFKIYLLKNVDSDLNAIAYTLQVGKNELPCRLSLIVRDRLDLLRMIESFLGAKDSDVLRAETRLRFEANCLAHEILFDEERLARDLQTKALDRIADQWVRGASINWDGLYDYGRPTKVSLPAYPFEKIRCWYEPFADAPSVLEPSGARAKLHPFLGKNDSDLLGVKYTLTPQLNELLDYAYSLDGQRQIIATFAIDAALALTGIANFSDANFISGLTWNNSIDWNALAYLRSEITTLREGEAEGRFLAEPQQEGVAPLLVCQFQCGKRGPQDEGREQPDSITLAQLKKSADEIIGGQQFYTQMAKDGLNYKPFLEGVDEIRRIGSGRLLLHLRKPDLRQDHGKKNIHFEPTTLGAILQGLQFFAKECGLPQWQYYIPLLIERIARYKSGGDERHLLFDLACYGNEVVGEIRLLDTDGKVLSLLSGIRFCHRRELANAAHLALPMRAQATEPLTAQALPRRQTENVLPNLSARLRAIVSDISRFDIDEIDEDSQFYAFGFDSISFIDLTNRINHQLKLKLNPVVFFEYKNIRELCGFILAHHGTQLEEEVTEKTATSLPTLSPRASEGHGRQEPIAIIGAACRFPGSETLADFWQNLMGGADLVAPFPPDRYDKFYRDAISSAPFPHWAATIANVERFDAGLFNISRLEAELMDPQHRIALETAWGALEDSGYAPGRLPPDTGVFLGVSGSDYATLLTNYGVPPDAFTATGNSHAMLVNRISFLLDIHGPSEPIDTACSSSLVAVHRAVECIRSGRCEMALAGGVNLLLSVDTFVSAHLAGMLSPDGRCKTFSKEANGYVRGEGVGVIVLKALSQAERDHDQILGVIIGSAENHGGRASSLTAPNTKAQAEVIEAAMEGIDPRTVSYIETHGTGTSLGDPAEINGLKLAYERLLKHYTNHSAQEDSCGLGSVKTNIGHLEAAAGIAGLIKVLLAMKHRLLPAALHCREVNPYIELAGSPFYLVRDRTPWACASDNAGRSLPRRASVSSFGFGGANAHVVIEEYVARRPAPSFQTSPASSCLFLLSAKDESRLKAIAGNLLDFLRYTPEEDAGLHDIAYTLQVGREAMEERLAFFAATRGELSEKLNAFIRGAVTDGLHRGRVKRLRDASTHFAHGTETKQFIAAQVQEGEYGQLPEYWVKGLTFNWETIYRGPKPQRISLPTYPFAGERYWIPSKEAETRRRQDASTVRHDAVFDEAFFGRLIDDVVDDVVSIETAVQTARNAGALP